MPNLVKILLENNSLFYVFLDKMQFPEWGTWARFAFRPLRILDNGFSFLQQVSTPGPGGRF